MLSSDPLIELVLTGSCHRIYALTDGPPLSLRRFLTSIRAAGPTAARLLDEPDRADSADRPNEWKRLLALMRRAADHGVETVGRNPSRCKCFVPPLAHTRNARTEVCEFKSFDARVLFFRELPVSREPCTTLIITHVFSKKQDATPPAELARFADLQARYYAWRDGLRATDAIGALSHFTSPRR